MHNMIKEMHGHFPVLNVLIQQSLDMFGVRRDDDGKIIFPRNSDNRFPVGRIRKRLAAWAGAKNA